MLTCKHGDYHWALCPQSECKAKADTYWSKKSLKPTHVITIPETAEGILMEQVVNAIIQEFDEMIMDKSGYQDSLVENTLDIIHATLEECQVDNENPYKNRKIYYSM